VCSTRHVRRGRLLRKRHIYNNVAYELNRYDKQRTRFYLLITVLSHGTKQQQDLLLPDIVTHKYSYE